MQPSLPQQNDCKITVARTLSTALQNKEQTQGPHKQLDQQ